MIRLLASDRVHVCPESVRVFVHRPYRNALQQVDFEQFENVLWKVRFPSPAPLISNDLQSSAVKRAVFERFLKQTQALVFVAGLDRLSDGEPSTGAVVEWPRQH